MTSATVPSIDQLRELPPGEPPFSYLPQTWAWAAVGTLLLVIAGLWLARWLWRWHRDRYRREALAQLAELERRTGGHDRDAVRELPELLKRVGMSMPGAAGVASLVGEQWQAFMAAHARTPLPSDFSQALQRLAYAPPANLQALSDAQVAELFETSRRWIAGHHVAV